MTGVADGVMRDVICYSMRQRLYRYSMLTRGVDMKLEEDGSPDNKPTVASLIGSVLSAAVGIQTSKNHERDIKHGKASTFVIAGIIYAGLFVGAIVILVHVVLKISGI
jgi:hypothetical protein